MIPVEVNNRSRKRVGRYLVTGRIGRGGMGMVYRGYDEILEREVAIKTLTLEGQLDDESRRRFEIEAKAAAKLQHPNILTVFELSADRGIPFIAMELLPGVDLELLLRSGEALLLQEKLDIVIQVCRGLAFAHDHHIVHRDIKPSNIRLLDDGSVKIMDFGIAKLGGTSLTKSGMMVGTVHYMSPEQVRGQRLDGRSDVFSVGVILYELLAGKRPFGGKEATEVLYKIVHEEAAAIDFDLGGPGPRLREILGRALAKDREARYPNASKLADDLADVRASETRLSSASVSPETMDTVGAARSLLREGRVEEGHRRLREVVEKAPHLVEARRALRAATREIERRKRPAEKEQGDDFPELEATYQVPPTRRAPETKVLAGVAATTHHQPPPTALRRGPVIAAGVGALGTFALAVALLVPGGNGKKGGSAKIQVRSNPAGAAILVDGKETGVVTNGEVTLPAEGPRASVTWRKAGYREVTRVVSLPPPEGQPLTADLVGIATPIKLASDPAGASVTLDGQRVEGVTPLGVEIDPTVEHRIVASMEGYQAKEVVLPAGSPPPEVRVSLSPAGPLGTVQVASGFPLDVLWKGKVVAKGQASPRVSLPAGRQSLTLVSSAYFLKASVNVDVRSGVQSGVEAPGLGKISIMANPDNCKILINGVLVDSSPILEMQIAAGSHTVTFKWPDGVQREETARVTRDQLTYVMGRRD